MQRTIVLACLFLGSMLMPTLAQAAYTFEGHTFDTRAEYRAYLEAYAETWRELYGAGRRETRSATASAGRTTDTRQSAGTARGLRVTTNEPSEVTTDEVRFSGTIRHGAAEYAALWFLYGTREAPYASSTVREVRDADDRSSRFDAYVLDLAHNTRYYVIAVAEDEWGNRVYGDWESFKTAVDTRIDRGVARVQTQRPRYVDESHATFVARVDLRDADVARVWFEYGDEENDLYQRTSRVLVRSEGTRYVERSVRHLADETTYYVRAVIEEASGARTYGRTYRFATREDVEDEQPSIDVERASDVEERGFTVAGRIDMNDMRNGYTFVLYGEDEDALVRVGERYDEYDEIREDGDVLQVLLLDDDLDTRDTYAVRLYGLDPGIRHYYTLGVSYEDQDDDEVLLLGRIRSATTRD